MLPWQHYGTTVKTIARMKPSESIVNNRLLVVKSISCVTTVIQTQHNFSILRRRHKKIMLHVFRVMLHVFPVTLHETCATLHETRATLEETPAM